jgi:protein archease
MTRDLDAGGHRFRPHTADVIVEAWGATRAACLEETVRGVVDTFADVTNVHATREIPLEVNAALDEDVVVTLVGDVCYLIDAEDLVVVDLEVEEAEDGSLEGMFYVAPVAAVQPEGAPPKGISRSDLSFERVGSEWHCHVVVDV